MEDTHPLIQSATPGGPDRTSFCNQQKRAMGRPASIEGRGVFSSMGGVWLPGVDQAVLTTEGACLEFEYSPPTNGHTRATLTDRGVLSK
jgi:hypothetical protein